MVVVTIWSILYRLNSRHNRVVVAFGVDGWVGGCPLLGGVGLLSTPQHCDTCGYKSGGYTKGPNNLFFKPGTRVRFYDNLSVFMTTPTLLRV